MRAAAWARLHDRYTPRLRGLARALGADDFDDTVGDVRLHAVKDLPRFSG